MSRLKDHYYVYSALLQMVEMLNERTLDCLCKKRHAKKWLASSKLSAEWIICFVVGGEYLCYRRILNNLS